jgi:predicted dehydrogenase
MRVAMIGSGWTVRVQIPVFRMVGMTVTALAGSNAAKTAAIAADIDVPFATGDWRELLERDDVDLISIVTPPDLHAEMAIAALAAGKHVLCEKPTALNSGEAEQMLAAAQAHPELLAIIDHELRFLPAIQHARQLIADGAIGQVQQVAGHLYNAARVDAQREWNWWSDESRGGGAFGAIGSHQIDLLRFVLSDEVQRIATALQVAVPERPTAAGMRAVTADDSYTVWLDFSRGARVSLNASLAVHLNEPDSLTFFGSQGTLRWTQGQLWHATAGKPLVNVTPAHHYQLPEGMSGEFQHGTVYLGHALRAYAAGDREALSAAATFSDGVAIQRALDAGRRSAAQRSGFEVVA